MKQELILYIRAAHAAGCLRQKSLLLALSSSRVLASTMALAARARLAAAVGVTPGASSLDELAEAEQPGEECAAALAAVFPNVGDAERLALAAFFIGQGASTRKGILRALRVAGGEVALVYARNSDPPMRLKLFGAL